MIKRDGDEGNVLEKARVAHLFDLHDLVFKLEATSAKGDTFTYSDICFRLWDSPSAPCSHLSPAKIWAHNKTAFSLDPAWLPKMKAVFGPGLGQLKGNTSEGILMQYDVQGNPDSDDLTPDDVLVWEREFVKQFSREPTSDLDDMLKDLNIRAFAPVAYDDDIKSLVDKETLLIVVSTILIVLFMAAVLGQRTRIKSKVALGCSALVTILLSLTSALGFGGYVGWWYTPISPFTLFMVLGIGADDILLIAQHVQRATNIARSLGCKIVFGPGTLARGANIEEWAGNDISAGLIMAEALRGCGNGILLTTLTDVAAFGIGGAITVVSVRNFALVSMVAVVVVFILSITLFVGLATYDLRRELAHRMDCFCCVTVETDDDTHDEEMCEDPDHVHVVVRGGGAYVLPNEGEETEQIPQNPSGCVPPSWKEGGIARHWIIKYAYLLTNKWMQLGVAVAFTAIIIGSAFSIEALQTGVPLNEVLPPGSLTTEFVEAVSDTFDSMWEPSRVVLEDTVEYRGYYEQQGFRHLQVALDKHDCVARPVKRADVWWLAFHDWMIARNSSVVVYPPGVTDPQQAWLAFQSNDVVKSELKAFENTPGFQQFQRHRLVDDDKAIVPFTMILDFDSPLVRQRCSDELGELFNESALDCHLSTVSRVGAEADKEYKWVVASNFIFATIAVLVVLLFFIPLPVAVVTTFCVAVICVIVFASIYWWGRRVNAVVFVGTSVSVGLTVDYTAHLGIAFVHNLAFVKSKKDAIILALANDMGVAVMYGAFSSFLGFCVLYFATSETFRLTAQVMTGVIFFGFGTGMSLFPTMLLWIPDRFLNVGTKIHH
jgi:Patched family